jgi:hypothetical protein
MLELGRRAIRGLHWGRSFRMSVVLYVIAGALAATQPEAAAIIQAPPNSMGRVAAIPGLSRIRQRPEWIICFPTASAADRRERHA